MNKGCVLIQGSLLAAIGDVRWHKDRQKLEGRLEEWRFSFILLQAPSNSTGFLPGREEGEPERAGRAGDGPAENFPVAFSVVEAEKAVTSSRGVKGAL